jgi:hypothetical protein
MARDITSDMRDKFGDEQTEEYMILAKATRSLVFMWRVYIETPTGSFQEVVTGQALSKMMDGLKDRPEHAVSMVESLLAIIEHMRRGGTFEDWFETLGVSPTPEDD